MKAYILTDLEGPAGVNRWIQTREGETPEKRAAMALLTEEVNAAIDGIREAASDADVIVWDGHGDGGLDFARLHPECRVLLRGVGLQAPYGLDETFDALFFVGQHAMAGTPDAPLCHTFSSRQIEQYRLNDAPIGEFGCRAAMAGALGIPTVFVAGDDKACAEARALVPEIVTVETKQGLGIELALHLSAERARRAIRAGAAEAVRAIPRIPSFRIDPPYRLEIRVLEGVEIRSYLKPGWEQVDERTVVRQSGDWRDVLH
jgi:D-amino peptidase